MAVVEGRKGLEQGKREGLVFSATWSVMCRGIQEAGTYVKKIVLYRHYISGVYSRCQLVVIGGMRCAV